MITLKRAANSTRSGAFFLGMILYGTIALAQSATDTCKPIQVIPLAGAEPAAKLIVSSPLAEPLASRGVVIIPYCAENMHIAPVFGSGALTVSPRVGHIHVTVDESPWRWADASGPPVILQVSLPENRSGSGSEGDERRQGETRPTGNSVGGARLRRASMKCPG